MTESDSEIGFKEIALVLPVTASALALSFEIGRFYPFGGFRFFSISEHILSAIAYLPVAMIFTAGAVLLFSLYAWIMRLVPDLRRTGNLIFGAIISAIYVVGLIFCVRFLHKPFQFAYSGSIFLPLLWIAIFFERPLSRPAGLLALIAYGIAASLIVAANLSYALIEKANTDPSAMTNINLKGGTKTAILVMIGDRGVLFYDPATNKTTLARLDDLKELEWDAP